MDSRIPSRLSFENYSSQARNNFQKSKEELRQYAYVSNQINDYYVSAKNKQGIIGKTWDKIKCLFNLKGSSKQTEEILNKYQNNIYDSSSEATAIIAMNEYAQSQETATNVARNFVASSTAGTLFTFLNKNLKKTSDKKIAAIIVLSSVVGSALGVALKAIDAKTANRKYDKEEFGKDSVIGLSQGLLSSFFSFGIINFIGDKLSVISRMLVKSIAKTVFNTLSAFSVAVMEAKMATNVLKYLNPQRYQTMMEKMKEQEKMDEYQFYNPRYELNKVSESC